MLGCILFLYDIQSHFFFNVHCMNKKMDMSVCSDDRKVWIFVRWEGIWVWVWASVNATLSETMSKSSAVWISVGISLYIWVYAQVSD